MRGLAIPQPWAELMMLGKKKVEIRNRYTNIRGWIYIYASRKDTKPELVKQFDFDTLLVGFIIGKAFLADVKRYGSDEEFYKDEHLHLMSKEILASKGWRFQLKPRYGYIITKVERLEKPVPYAGNQGFFDVNLPEEYLQSV